MKTTKKKKLTTITSVITGHYKLRKHLFTMGVGQSSLCDNCGPKNETAEQYICFNPSFNSIRLAILGERLL